MVAAKTDRAHEGLAQQFAAHSIDRRYLAIVGGPSAAGRRHGRRAARAHRPHNRKKIAIVAERQARGHALPHDRAAAATAALVECRLETGRTHQVRVHMASIGHPLLGDPVYGRTESRHTRRCCNAWISAGRRLHAARLGFIHPVTSNALSFDSDMPADMQELFSQLHV